MFKRFLKKFACSELINTPKDRARFIPRSSFQIAPLYVILPYFNYCKYESRTKLFLDFIKRVGRRPLLKLVVIEATPKGQPFDLPDFSSDLVCLHLKVELTDRIWIKENLINLAIRNLPEPWTYVAWVDADLTFTNESWVQDTIQALKKVDVVQMFDSAVNLGPNGETLKTERGFVYQYLNSPIPYHAKNKYGVWHPGYAWACHRRAYEKMGGLFDVGILGSGDRHMALAWIGKGELSYPNNIHLDYMVSLKTFQDKCQGIQLGYVPGTILHHFHGSLKDRP